MSWDTTVQVVVLVALGAAISWAVHGIWKTGQRYRGDA